MARFLSPTTLKWFPWSLSVDDAAVISCVMYVYQGDNTDIYLALSYNTNMMLIKVSIASLDVNSMVLVETSQSHQQILTLGKRSWTKGTAIHCTATKIIQGSTSGLVK